MKKMKLKDLINIRTGKLDANASSENGKYPFFTCSKETLKINTYSYDCECVLLAGNGDLNVKYYNGKFDAYQRTYILECKNDIISTKYLYYFMKKYLKILRNQSIGGVIKYIKLANISEAIIPIYSKEEQEEIVNNISKVEEVLNIKNKQIEELQNFIKSQFVEMFGETSEAYKKHRIIKLSEIAEYYNGLTYKPVDVSEMGTIVLRSGNIQNSKLEYSDIVRVKSNIKEKQYVKENDILMCSRNGSEKLVGKVAMIKEQEEKMTFGAFMLIIRSKYYTYLFSYFQSDDFRKKIKYGATTTINQITVNMLNKLELPMPDIKLQNQFSEIVKQIDKQKFEIEKSLKETQELYESLMEKYFG